MRRYINKRHWSEDYLVSRAGGNCSECGRSIKNIYRWENREYGIGCLRKIALPVLIKQWQKAKNEREAAYNRKKFEWYCRDRALAETLRIKDMSRIKNEWKKEFISSVVVFFDRTGFITPKQKEKIWGTGAWMGGWYDNGMLNNKDYDNEERFYNQYINEG